MAVAPPCGAHTESRPRGRPPLGSTLSSAAIPVATCSVVCAPPVSGVASGKRCSISARRAAMDVDMRGEEAIPKINRKQELIHISTVPEALTKKCDVLRPIESGAIYVGITHIGTC